MFVSRRRHEREVALAAAYASMDLEDQFPHAAVAALRLFAGSGDSHDESILDTLGTDAGDSPRYELVERVLALAEAATEECRGAEERRAKADAAEAEAEGGAEAQAA